MVFNSPYPFPGTELFTESIKKGKLERPENWIKYTKKLSNQKFVNLTSLCNNELEEFRKQAYKQVYIRPKYLLTLIKYLNWRELRTFIKGIEMYLS